MKAVDQFKHSLCLIESYREALQESHKWIDSLIKDLDLIDMGNNTTCLQKLETVRNIEKSYSEQYPQRLTTIYEIKDKLVAVISNLDSQQVEEQVKGIERRFNDLSKRIIRKLQTLEATTANLTLLTDDMNNTLEWLNTSKKSLSASPKQPPNEVQLYHYKDVLKQTDDKQIVITTLEKRIAELQSELEPIEQMNIQNQIQMVNLDCLNLKDMLKHEIANLNKYLDQQKKQMENLERTLEQIKEVKSNLLRDSRDKIPLNITKVEDNLSIFKKYWNSLQQIKDSGLIEIDAPSLSPMDISIEKKIPDETSSQIIIVQKEFKDAEQIVTNRLTELNEALPYRRSFYGHLKSLTIWINTIQENLSLPFRAADIHTMEDQLRKYEMFSGELTQNAAILASFNDLGSKIKESLNIADNEVISTELNLINNRFSNIGETLRDNISLANKTIEAYKDDKARLMDCQQFLELQKAALKNLNRPIGNRIEDVKAMLEAYESILENLRESKTKITPVTNENLPELHAVKQQQDDLITSIENQLSRLRQLLLLREQFISTINQIVAIIEQCNKDVGQIGIAGENADAKLNKLILILNNVQDAEALLASAGDKGNKIGSEGTMADKNTITDLLHSLKVQIQSTRKLVDNQKQKLEDVMQEHKKLINELSNAIDDLQQQEIEIKSRPILGREATFVDRDISKLSVTKKSIERKLFELKKIVQKCELDATLPNVLAEKLSEARLLMQAIPKELGDLEAYLNNHKGFRLGYGDTLSKINCWIDEAENKLRGNTRFNMQRITEEINSHKVYFLGDGEICKDLELLENKANKIYLSLSPEDQRQQTEEVREVKAKVEEMLNLANEKLIRLEEHAQLFKEILELNNSLTMFVNSLRPTIDPIDNINSVHNAEQKITQFLNNFQVRQTLNANDYVKY